MITLPDPRRRPLGRGFLAVLVAMVLVLSASCSDAPTEAEIEMADDGIDPSIITIFVPEQLELTVQQLGATFLADHRGITFQYTVNSPEVLTDRLRQGFEPSLWIDDSAVLQPFLDHPAVRGEPVTFGDDPLQFVVTKSYPGPEPTLAVFGAGTSAARSGLCEEAVRCGAGPREMLAQLDITPAPDIVRPTGRDLVSALNEDVIDTAIVYRSDSARIYTFFEYIPLPDPDIGRIIFQSLRFTSVPVTLEFQTWIQTSPDAEAILRKNGYIPFIGSRTP